MKLKVSQKTSILFALFFVAACGVKGDPQPPDTPAEISRGKADLNTDLPVDRPLTSPGEQNKKKKKDESGGK